MNVPHSNTQIEREVFGSTRPWYRWIVMAALAGAVVFFAGYMTFACHGPAIDAYLRGETTLAGARRYEPPHPIDAVAIATIDAERVHRELLPNWMLAASRPNSPRTAERERAAFVALRSSVEPDANLTAILDEQRALLQAGELEASGQRIIYLTWAWSRYLDRNALPFWVVGNVAIRPEHSFFYSKSYRTLSESRVQVGERDYRARLLTRIDDTNVVEQYLGAASRHADGAFVVIDRTRDFVLEHVWPMLDRANDGWLRPIDFAFAEAVRAEAGQALTPQVLEILRSTAGHRDRINRAVRSVHVRHRCGSSFHVNNVPFAGFGDQDLERIAAYGRRDAGRHCPDVTEEEAATFTLSSLALRETAELKPAVGALVAWLARNIAIHEARHAADDALVDGLNDPMTCHGCVDDTPVIMRAELSAYLATLAWSASPGLAFYQMCRSVAREQGPHHEALLFILGQLGQACENGPPPDLPARCRSIELEVLGRSQVIKLAGDFPTVLPVGR